MYPNDIDVAGVILAFALLGAVFGLLYELLRFFRHLIPAREIRANIEDALFIVLAGVLMFIIVIMMNGNQLRLYHILGTVTGFFIYIATIGRLINCINKKICGLLRRFLHCLFAPLHKLLVRMTQKTHHKLSRLYKIFTNSTKNAAMHLKNKHDIVYNDNTYKSILKRGEPRNVIKAKIK